MNDWPLDMTIPQRSTNACAGAGQVTRHKEQPLIEDTTSVLRHYLSGYLQGQPHRRRFVQDYPAWATAAQAELDRRAMQFLSILPETELQAIAAGRVDLAELAALANGP